MAYVRAAYLSEIAPHLYKRQYPVPEQYSLRQTRHGPIEVWGDLRIKVCWRDKNSRPKKGYWIARRGQVLTVKHRPPTNWEKKERALPAEEQEIQIPVESVNGKQLVAIVERDQDLYSAARRFLRHIARSLNRGRLRARDRREPGRFEQTEQWTLMLYDALMELTRDLKPESPHRQRAFKLLGQMANVLSRTRQTNLSHARRAIEQTKGDDRIIKIAEAIGLIGEYRRDVLAQMQGTARKGLSIHQIMDQIDQGLNLVFYKGIPDLLKLLRPYALEGRSISAAQLTQFAHQAVNIGRNIKRVCGGFKPYSDRAHSPQVRRLENAPEYAERNDALGLYHALIRAHAKIETLVLETRPLPQEVKTARQTVEDLAY